MATRLRLHACLRRLGLPLNARVVRWEVEEGQLHLDTMRWLVEQDALWDKAGCGQRQPGPVG